MLFCRLRFVSSFTTARRWFLRSSTPDAANFRLHVSYQHLQVMLVVFLRNVYSNIVRFLQASSGVVYRTSYNLMLYISYNFYGLGCDD